MTNNQKNIFLIFNSFNLGGIQRKMIDIADFIDHSKYGQQLKIWLIFFDDNDAFFLTQTTPQKKYRICFLTKNHLKQNEKNRLFIYRLAKLIIKQRPVAIISFLHLVSPKVIIANLIAFIFSRHRTRIIISQDNILSLENSKENEPHPKKKFLISFFYRFAFKIIVQTEFAKKDLIAQFALKSEKIKVIPNWSPSPSSISHSKSKVKNDRQIDVVYLGRFAKQKKLMDFLKIIKLIKKEVPTIRVQIFGSGKQSILNQMLLFIHQNDLNKNISLLHPTTQPDKILQKSKVLLLTSAFEGQPMVVLEAMRFGCAVVVKKYPGVEEYIENKKSGFIFSSTQAGAQLIIELIRSKTKRDKIASSAYKVMEQKFNPQELIPQTLDEILN